MKGKRCSNCGGFLTLKSMSKIYSNLCLDCQNNNDTTLFLVNPIDSRCRSLAPITLNTINGYSKDTLREVILLREMRFRELEREYSELFKSDIKTDFRNNKLRVELNRAFKIISQLERQLGKNKNKVV